MNGKLRAIINHYGIEKQLKYFQSEVFELSEAIIKQKNCGLLESVIDGVCDTFASVVGVKRKDYKREHVKEEIADAMVMLKQFQLYYDIPTEKITEVMQNKVARQIDRIKEEIKNVK